jgi:TPR repeat protein
MLVIMDKSWLRRLFDSPPDPDRESTQTKADDGNAEAQFSLGLKFASGKPAEQDFAQAVYWYLKAADQNHALAQFNLGIMFATVRGTARDDARALMWIQRAARQGDPGAQHNLGMRNRRASFEGLPQDSLECNLEAYKWFRLAAAQGYRGSDNESMSIALGLTREQVAEGDHRAAAFIVATGSDPVPA